MKLYISLEGGQIKRPQTPERVYGPGATIRSDGDGWSIRLGGRQQNFVDDVNNAV